MSKRVLSLLLVIALGVSLCACDGMGTKSDSEDEYNPLMFEVPEGGYDGSEVSISIGFVGGWDFLDKYIMDFNKQYPNIEIIIVDISQEAEDIYDRIIFTKGKMLPNIVFALPDQIAEYKLTKWVVALDNLINHPEVGFSQEELEDFVPAFYNQGKEFGDGDMYSLPVGRTAEVLFYNKTFFEEHQIKVPTTWTEMEEVCDQIKNIDSESVPLGYEVAPDCFITMSKQLGSGYTSATGAHYLFDNEENYAFTKKIQEWYKKGYLYLSSPMEGKGGFTTTPAGQSGDITSMFSMDMEKKCYMVIAPASYASVLSPREEWDGTYPFEAGVSMVPQYDVSNPKVSSRGIDMCIMQSENPQEVMASWLFVKYLETNLEFQTAYALQGRYMPVLKSAVDEPEFASRLENANGQKGLYMLAMKLCIEQQDAYFTLPAFPDAEYAYIKVGRLLVQAVESEEPIESLFKQIKSTLD